jgi:hypothetical protein
MTARKTVAIDDDLRIEIDRLRNERGVSMKVVVNEALRRGLDKIEEEEIQTQRPSGGP